VFGRSSWFSRLAKRDAVRGSAGGGSGSAGCAGDGHAGVRGACKGAGLGARIRSARHTGGRKRSQGHSGPEGSSAQRKPTPEKEKSVGVDFRRLEIEGFCYQAQGGRSRGQAFEV